ncbi:CHASE2 domain-containing protein [Nostoc sp. NIES-3756]|uniref:CHASE2 domain-containing protein n=1 Tax=Nostoc sp. NIES-3756 TaxID=1751286 RepID=UPI00083552DB|nr:CHASE2 domain-containing protein [Nostoc sp. NIES-3756]
MIITSAIATALFTGIRELGWLQAQELWAFDQFIQLRGDEGLDHRLLIVAITEEDIQSQKQWPLPDSIMEKVLDKLEQQQPRVIGLDIYRDFAIPPGTAELSKRFQNSDRIIAVCKVNDTSGNPGIAPPPGIPENRVGFSDLLVDSGGILRRNLLFLNPPVNKSKENNFHICQNPSADLFSFSLQLALNYLKVENIKPKLTASQELQLGSVIFKRLKSNAGGYQNIDISGYQILLNYRSSEQIAPQVTLTELLTDKVNPNLIKDRIVLIGTTAESVKDLFYTPYSAGKQKEQYMVGVMIHAQAVSQILSAVLNKRPLLWYWPNWGETLWIGLWSLTGGAIAWQIRHPLRFGIISTTAIVVLFGICSILFYQGAWIPVIPPLFTFITTAGSVVIVDRFHKSGYTKTIYQHLTNPFKLNVEIDQSKKERQVAKITQTAYFQDLQKKGKELRTKKAPKSGNINSNSSIDANEITTKSHTSNTKPIMQMKNKHRKESTHEENTN